MKQAKTNKRRQSSRVSDRHRAKFKQDQNTMQAMQQQQQQQLTISGTRNSKGTKACPFLSVYRKVLGVGNSD